jgi:hypothetical protein
MRSRMDQSIRPGHLIRQSAWPAVSRQPEPASLASRPGSAIYCAATAVTMPVTMALAGAGFSQSSRPGGYGGLFQRASIITGFARLTAVSARALQRTPPAPPEHPDMRALSRGALRESPLPKTSGSARGRQLELTGRQLELDPGYLLGQRAEPRPVPVVRGVQVVGPVRCHVSEVGDDREAPRAVPEAEVVTERVADRARAFQVPEAVLDFRYLRGVG